MRSRSSFTEESSIGSNCSASSEPTWRLVSMTREVTVGSRAEQVVARKPPSRRVWPTAKAPFVMAPSLKTGRGILPDRDGTEELSMKAPMSVSKPADLREGVPNCGSRSDGNRRQGALYFTQVRALSMEVKPYSCLINIDDMGSTRVDLPRDQGG